MTMGEGGKITDHHHEVNQPSSTQPNQYGTFQGVPTYPPPHHQSPAMGFPQPAPPPEAFEPSAPQPPHTFQAQYYSGGYQAVPGYAVAEGRPVTERRLPCCGMGFGWFLFIIGFCLAGIPWYVGTIVLLCSRNLDYREKPGYIGCTVAAILTTVAIVIGATKGADDW